MSQVKAFYETLVQNKALQEEAKTLNKSSSEDKSANTKAIIDFAKSKGFDFTAGDLEEYEKNLTKESGDLSIEDLEAVAGGSICILGGKDNDRTCGCFFGGGGKGGMVCVLIGV
jgi:predicted ribosomally synthesized peptide with nif11-like leader